MTSKVLNRVVAKSADFASYAEALSTATQDMAYAQVPALPGDFSGEFQGWYDDVYLKFNNMHRGLRQEQNNLPIEHRMDIPKVLS